MMMMMMVPQLQKHIVSPLMSIARELNRQKEELVGIIKRKDREIQDYKDGGASISRRQFSRNKFLLLSKLNALVYI